MLQVQQLNMSKQQLKSINFTEQVQKISNMLWEKNDALDLLQVEQEIAVTKAGEIQGIRGRP